MNGDIKEEAIQVTWKATEISAKVLKTIIQTLLENRQKITHGEQSLNKLNLQNKQLESIKINSNDLKSFRRELNSYAIDFSIKLDKCTGEYTVFFKGQDIDRVYKGLEKCINRVDLSKKKPIKKVMENAIQKAQERFEGRQAHRKTQSVDRRQER